MFSVALPFKTPETEVVEKSGSYLSMAAVG